MPGPGGPRGGGGRGAPPPRGGRGGRPPRRGMGCCVMPIISLMIIAAVVTLCVIFI
ncbi:MAG: hypothetical protein LUD47_08090 [Clostridia bacterium]|nr:hypothetical protein [Clostridia bacterium]